jgi:hypothetical protein
MLALPLVADIGWQNQRLSASLLTCCCEGIELVDPTGGKGQTCPLIGQFVGQRLTDAARCTSGDYNAIFERCLSHTEFLRKLDLRCLLSCDAAPGLRR